MFRWGKSTKNPAPAAGEEVAVQKVEKIEFHNLVHIKPPVRAGGGAIGNAWKPQPRTASADSSGAARKPDSPGDDINSRAGRFIEDTKKRWRLGVKSFGGR
ncbi:hypothetical protein CFC21_048391 [Triticum aestivum]|nr:hypothetical protein CFC21_010539 [Triticum aestivum]KAF7038185.1 hypothetical protein CFC21_048391 [Triticum aestivum]